MSSVDKYLDKKYNFHNYNCSHFVAEVWKDLTGENISELCQSFVKQDPDFCKTKLRARKRLRQPETPSVCFMQAHNLAPHAGVYMDGKILHIGDLGVLLDPVSDLKPYYRLSYYK